MIEYLVISGFPTRLWYTNIRPYVFCQGSGFQLRAHSTICFLNDESACWVKAKLWNKKENEIIKL